MTKQEYAAHRQVSPAMVTKWRHAGRLVLRGAMVDVAASDALLAQVQDLHRGGKRDRLVSGAQTPAGKASGGGASAGAGAPPPAAPPPAIVTATVADKEASAGLKRARLYRELGRLVDREHFEAGTQSAAAATQRGVMTLPARLALLVEQEFGVDARRLIPRFEDECRAILNDQAAAIEALADQIESTTRH